MDNIKYKGVVKYFKNDKSFDRLFKELEKKYRIYDKPLPGSITINNPTSEEKNSLSQLMKKDYTLNKSITIKLEKLQIAINNTKYEGTELKKIVELYIGDEIKTYSNLKQEEIMEYSDYVESLITEHSDKQEIVHLIKMILLSKSSNSIWIKNLYIKDKTSTVLCINKTLIAIKNLPKLKKERLPVFSSRIYSNPHMLDKNSVYQKMLNIFLKELYIARTQITSKILDDTESRSQLYYYFNILIDDVSNMVLCKNIVGIKNNVIHKGWENFYLENEATQMTLNNLYNIDKVKTYRKIAIVTENPSVFMGICENLNAEKIPIVCTYGQIKLSGIILLDFISKEVETIYYSGDIDPEGLLIADKLKSKYKEKLKFIGYDKETYMKNMSNVEISQIRLNKLNKIRDTGLKELSNEIKMYRKAAYEEENIKYITMYIKNTLNLVKS